MVMESESASLIPSDKGPPPQDRYKVVYLIFCLLGLGSLLPWNFFITAKEYYHYKLRNISLPEGSNVDDPLTQTELETLFEGSVAVSSMIPNLVFNFSTAALSRRLSLRLRMVISLATVLVLFIITLILVGIDADTWQVSFFVVTLSSVVILSAASSVFTASMFGLAGKFPTSCMQAAVNGQAVGGVFSAVANIITLQAGTSVVISAYAYFGAAVFTISITLVGYILLYHINYSKFYIHNTGVGIQEEGSHSSISQGLSKSDVLYVLKKIWKEGVSLFVVFFVSLACFPAVASAIQSLSGWEDKMFSALVCFLLYNVGDWSGRIIAGFARYPRANQSRCLMVLSFLRIVYVPVLLLCNAQPRTLPLVFNSDIYPVVFILTLGITNGYLCTIGMMYGPKKVPAEYAEFAGTSLCVFMTTGLAAGSMMSLGLVKIINL